MFAVLKTGGKQYKVQSGDVLRVEKLAADAGETVQFNEILMVGANVGTPLVDGAGVQADVIEQIKGDKDVKCVIVQVDSPGGTLCAAEALYQEFKHLPSVRAVYNSCLALALGL